MYIEGVDSIDNKIIRLLKKNARMSYSAIGEEVGLSRVAVKNRIDVLEQKRIITGYHVAITPEKCTQGLEFTIDLEVQQNEMQHIIDVLCKDKFIRKVYGTTGRNRIHCQGYVPSSKTLKIHAQNLFDHNIGILKLEWYIMMTTYKDEDGGVVYAGVKEDI